MSNNKRSKTVMAAQKRPKLQWFVLAVDPGTDKRIRREIQRSCRIRDCKDIGRIIIKHHIEDRLRDGKWVPCRVKSYPGYLIINMRFTTEAYHIVNNLKRFGVFGFLNLQPTLGGKRYPKKEKMQNTPPRKWEIELRENWMPTPIESVEVGFLLLDEQQVGERKEKLKKERRKDEERKEAVVEYSPDDKVRIIDGAFKGIEGIVIRTIDSQDGQTLTVSFVLIGRTTNIGISSTQVERVI